MRVVKRMIDMKVIDNMNTRKRIIRVDYTKMGDVDIYDRIDALLMTLARMELIDRSVSGTGDICYSILSYKYDDFVYAMRMLSK